MGRTKINYTKEDQDLIKGLRDLRQAGFLSAEDYRVRVDAIKAKYQTAEAKDEQAKKQREEAREVFKRFDTDGSGSIDTKELQNLIFSLGETMSSSEIAKLKQTLDKDNDGEISFDEFFEWWSAPTRGTSGADAQTFLKMKLQSTQYMKSLKSSAKAVRAKEKAKEKWNVDVDVSVGTITTPDYSFKLTAAMDTESELDGVGASLIFGLADGFDAKYIADGQEVFQKLWTLFVKLEEVELPFEPTFKFSVIDHDGHKALNVDVGIPSEVVPEEVTGIASAMLDGATAFAEFVYDQTHQALKWGLHIEAPKSIKEMAGEVAAEALGEGEDAEMVKSLLKLAGLFHSSKLRIKYRALEQPLIDQLKGQLTEDIQPLVDLAMKGDTTFLLGLFDEAFDDAPIAVLQAIVDFITNFTFLKCIRANLGSYKVQLDMNVAGGFQKFIKPAEILFDKTRILDQSSYEGPETIEVYGEKFHLKEEPYLKFFYICDWCKEFGKGKHYLSAVDADDRTEIHHMNDGEALHPLCAQELLDTASHKTCKVHQHPLVRVKSLDIPNIMGVEWTCSNLGCSNNSARPENMACWQCCHLDCSLAAFCADCLETEGSSSDSTTSSTAAAATDSETPAATSDASSSDKPTTCTFALHGATFKNQVWYRCLDCFPSPGTGCCAYCVDSCHKGHRTRIQKASDFYCDCGSGAGPQCSVTQKGSKKAPKKAASSASGSASSFTSSSSEDVKAESKSESFSSSSYSGSY